MKEHCGEQRELGVHIGTHAAWTVEEIALATEGRLKSIGCILRRLRDAGLQVVQTLWPAAVHSQTATRLARWLEAASVRINMWRASAAQAGVEMALSFALSWYPEIELAQLAIRRAGAEDDLVRLGVPITARANDIASFTPFDKFIRERAADGTEIPKDTYRLALDDPNGSDGETDDKGTGSSIGAYAHATPGAEADTGATTEPAQPGADAPAT